MLAGPTSDPAARTQLAQFGRWLVDTLREAPLQAPILLRDVWVATTAPSEVAAAVRALLASH
ncbi:hypothetical protein [Micromonospora rubida]|uniref:hypothetical protein n=1 Tax=Micromonospora rubida TaxID=2697657 RepID=UPI00191BE8F8|nr:hypothetical protein [Micromonospora rubida]